MIRSKGRGNVISTKVRRQAGRTEKSLLGIAVLAAVSFMFCIHAHAQTWKEITKEEFLEFCKSQDKFFRKITSFSMNVKHASYEDHTTTKSFEESTGYVKKEGMNMNSMMMGILTVQNTKIRLLVDSASSGIMIAVPDKDAGRSVSADEYAEASKICRSFKVMETKEGRIWRMEYLEGHSLSHTDVYANRSGMMFKVVMFYNSFAAKETWKSEAKKYKPRVEITFSDYKTGIKFNYAEMFDDRKYVTQLGKKYVGAGNYKEYKVFDTRVEQ